MQAQYIAETLRAHGGLICDASVVRGQRRPPPPPRKLHLDRVRTPEEHLAIRKALGAWFASQEIGYEDAICVMLQMCCDVLSWNAHSRADLEQGKIAFVTCFTEWLKERNADFAN
jgi:hypothetical protein